MAIGLLRRPTRVKHPGGFLSIRPPLAYSVLAYTAHKFIVDVINTMPQFKCIGYSTLKSTNQVWRWWGAHMIVFPFDLLPAQMPTLPCVFPSFLPFASIQFLPSFFFTFVCLCLEGFPEWMISVAIFWPKFALHSDVALLVGLGFATCPIVFGDVTFSVNTFYRLILF